MSVDALAAVQRLPLPEDTLYTIRGVGGTEVVFARQVDTVQLGPSLVHNFEIEVGAMDYGFAIQGILGMDFLMQAGVILNLRNMEIDFAD